MQTTNVKDDNLIVLANAVELASKVIQNVAGEAVATTIDGKIVSPAELKNAIAAKMQSSFPIAEGVN